MREEHKAIILSVLIASVFPLAILLQSIIYGHALENGDQMIMEQSFTSTQHFPGRADIPLLSSMLNIVTYNILWKFNILALNAHDYNLLLVFILAAILNYTAWLLIKKITPSHAWIIFLITMLFPSVSLILLQEGSYLPTVTHLARVYWSVSLIAANITILALLEKKWLIGTLAMFITAWNHPQIGIGTFAILLIISLYKYKNIKQLIPYVLGCLLALLLWLPTMFNSTPNASVQTTLPLFFVLEVIPLVLITFNKLVDFILAGVAIGISVFSVYVHNLLYPVVPIMLLIGYAIFKDKNNSLVWVKAVTVFLVMVILTPLEKIVSSTRFELLTAPFFVMALPASKLYENKNKLVFIGLIALFIVFLRMIIGR